MMEKAARRRIPHFASEGETVELRLGQREGPFQFYRVLGCDKHKGSRQGHGIQVYCNLLLLHTLQKARLRPGRGSVYLVDQYHIGHNRAGTELELTGLLVKIVDTGNIRW